MNTAIAEKNTYFLGTREHHVDVSIVIHIAASNRICIEEREKQEIAVPTRE